MLKIYKSTVAEGAILKLEEELLKQELTGGSGITAGSRNSRCAT